MKIAPRDKALFDERPTRSRTCWCCHGSGKTIETYALVPWKHFDGAPPNAVYAYASGDISNAVKEAVELAKRAKRPVAFEFNGQVVVAREDDDPDKITRDWWQRVYNETPEETFTRR